MNESVLKKGFKVPHTYVLIFSMIIIAAIMTYIIPAGEYIRTKNSLGATIIDVNSYQAMKQSPATILDIFSAPSRGMLAVAPLIFFVFVVGGSFQILNGTGSLNALIGKLVKKLEGKEELIIPVFLVTFSMAGAFMGVSDECIAFVPIAILVAKKCGFDEIVGMSMVVLGSSAGFNAGTMNAWSVGIAQSIAELPLFSGIKLRILMQIVFVLTVSIYLMRYAKKIKQDPTSSIVYGLGLEDIDSKTEIIKEVKLRDFLVLFSFVAGLIFVIYGVVKKGWYIEEMTPVFLAVGIIGGLIGGLTPSKIAVQFIEGAKALVFGALVIGLARGILVILQNGHILDTLVGSCANALKFLPRQITVFGIYGVNLFLNTFMPSGSGKAAAVMPLMIPISDMLGIGRQVSVLAFQLGDGITNSIVPTSSYMNGYLSVAKIPYPKWVKFVFPLIVIWSLEGLLFLTYATIFGYGPF